MSAGLSQLVTAEDVAAAWQVPVSQIYRLTREGQIPHVSIGRYYRYRLTDIEAFPGTNNEQGNAQQENT